MAERDLGRLSPRDKTALLGALKSRKPSAPVSGPAVALSRKSAPFSSLPGYKSMVTQRAVASVLGLENPFYHEHEQRAGAWTSLNRRRISNFASYDYLGLNGHPEIVRAVGEAVGAWGTSVSASRITAGERPFHRELETALAGVYQAEDAVTFVSGHATMVSTLAALMGARDLIIHDSLIHNCVVTGSVLSGATRLNFPHNDLDALEQILAANRDRHEHVMIVVEGLYSMDGDGPDLHRLIGIKEKWGAWLMVDEAHSLGVLGRRGLGIFEHQDVAPGKVDIWVGTMSKSLVSCGGYVAGSGELIDFLKFAAAGLVYSVGMPAANAAAATSALDILLREPERIGRLRDNGALFLRLAREHGLDTGLSWGAAITPILIGDSVKTVQLANRLLARHVNAVPIIPPGVPERSARLRFFLSSDHEPKQIADAVAILAEEHNALMGAAANGVRGESMGRAAVR